MSRAQLLLERLEARLASLPQVPTVLVGSAAVLALSAFAVRELFGGGMLLTGDTLHPLRLDAMRDCLDDGQLPCRWAPDLGRGYGYPLFNYYPPLPYYVGELLRRVFGLSFLATVDTLFLLGLLGAGVSMYLLGRRLWGGLGGVVSAIAYVYAPYLALDAYMRGALAELWALAIAPALFWAVHGLATSGNRRWTPAVAVLTAFLLLSHNGVAIIVAPVTALWAGVLLALRGREAVRPAWYTVGGALWGLGLAAFFTLPVLLQGDEVQLDNLTRGVFHYSRHYVGLGDLFGQRTSDYSFLLGVGNETPIQIGWFHWGLAALALPAGYLYARERRWRTVLAVGVLAAAFLIGVFMMTEASRSVWDAFSALRYLQFPWRYMGLVSLATAGLAGAWLGLLRARPLLLQLAAAGALVALFVASGDTFFHPLYRCTTAPDRAIDCPGSDEAYFSQDREAGAINDYLPNAVQELPETRPAAPARVVAGRATIVAAERGSNWLRLDVDVSGKQPALIETALFEFPQWLVTIDGEGIGHEVSEPHGLVTFFVPTGTHKVKVQLKDTLAREWGNAISLLSWLALLVLLPLLLPELPARAWYQRWRNRGAGTASDVRLTHQRGEDREQDHGHQRRDIDHADARDELSERRQDRLRDLIQKLHHRVVRIAHHPGKQRAYEDRQRQELDQRRQNAAERVRRAEVEEAYAPSSFARS